MSPAQIALWIVLSLALALSVATDVRQKLILDRVTVPALLAALLLRGLWMGPGDLGSSNGTWFNKQRIKRRKVEDGDEYYICSEKIKLVRR